MKVPSRKSWFFVLGVILLTCYAGSLNAAQMHSGPTVQERSGSGGDSSVGPRSLIRLDPSLVDDIEKNCAFLKMQIPRLRADLRELMRLGLLDRHTASGIQNSVAGALADMARLQKMEGCGKLRSTEATVIGDNLVSHAEALDRYIGEMEGGSGSVMGPQSMIGKQDRVVRVLSDISTMLHNTGMAIIREIH